MQTTDRPQPSLPTGTMLTGRYRIKAPLGSGGFGHVYRGQDVRLQREVAIKVLAVQTDASIEARFEREARAAGQLRHPNVVEVYDIGHAPEIGALFMVMELLHGHDLQVEVARCGRLTPVRALPLFCQALEALGTAHDRGIVHKDLKPENLFLAEPYTRQEHLKVLDFGVAAFMQDNARLTIGEQFFGTPLYLAPEYIKERAVSPAVDVYQMGLVLAEILMGHPVVSSDNIHLCLMAHCDGDLQLPQTLLDSPLGPVLFEALHRDPRRRFPDGHAFATALSGIDPALVPIPHLSEARWRVSALSASHKTVAHPIGPDGTNDLDVRSFDAIEDSMVGRLLGPLSDTTSDVRPPTAFAHGLWSDAVHPSGPELDLADLAASIEEDDVVLVPHDSLPLPHPTRPPTDPVARTPAGELAPLTLPPETGLVARPLDRPPLDDAPLADPLDRAPTRPFVRDQPPTLQPAWHERRPIRLAAAALLLLIGTAGAYALFDPTDAPTPAPDHAPVDAPAPPAPTQPPSTIARMIQLDTTPAGATVLDGATVLGSTPLVLTAPTDAPRTLAVEHPGYQRKDVLLSPDAPDHVLVPLTPLPPDDTTDARRRRRAARQNPTGPRPDRAWKLPD